MSAAKLASYLRDAAAQKRVPVKSFLMDGRVVVGIGNIYASETLARAFVHPLCPASSLSRSQWQRIAKEAQQVLISAIENGGTTLRDYVHGNGAQGQNHKNCAFMGAQESYVSIVRPA